MARETGYYWVRDDRERWLVALWNGAAWSTRTTGRTVSGVAEIGARIPNEQVPTHWLSAMAQPVAPEAEPAVV